MKNLTGLLLTIHFLLSNFYYIEAKELPTPLLALIVLIGAISTYSLIKKWLKHSKQNITADIIVYGLTFISLVIICTLSTKDFYRSFKAILIASTITTLVFGYYFCILEPYAEELSKFCKKKCGK